MRLLCTDKLVPCHEDLVHFMPLVKALVVLLDLAQIQLMKAEYSLVLSEHYGLLATG